MRRLFCTLAALAGVFSCGFLPNPLFGQAAGDLAAQVETVSDPALQQTLANSIAIGLIRNEQEFDAAFSEGTARKIRANPSAFDEKTGRSDLSSWKSALSVKIAKLTEPIASLDRDAMKDVTINDSRPGVLFNSIQGKIPASYEATFNLAKKFNPKVGTNEVPQLEKDIDAYLQSISEDPVIKYALQSTQTTINDLKRNWFGPGAGFEHVIAGEYKGGEVSGYHWWYKFYRDEKEGRTKFLKTLEGLGDQKEFTGRFSWDPDGPGPLPTFMKKKGGFAIGNSPQTLLALGHIAMETARKAGAIPIAITFPASVNGEVMYWQVYTLNGSLRSLYPMSAKSGDGTDLGTREYYESEGNTLKNFSAQGSESIH